MTGADVIPACPQRGQPGDEVAPSDVFQSSLPVPGLSAYSLPSQEPANTTPLLSTGRAAIGPAVFTVQSRCSGGALAAALPAHVSASTSGASAPPHLLIRLRTRCG